MVLLSYLAYFAICSLSDSRQSWGLCLLENKECKHVDMLNGKYQVCSLCRYYRCAKILAQKEWLTLIYTRLFIQQPLSPFFSKEKRTFPHSRRKPTHICIFQKLSKSRLDARLSCLAVLLIIKRFIISFSIQLDTLTVRAQIIRMKTSLLVDSVVHQIIVQIRHKSPVVLIKTHLPSVKTCIDATASTQYDVMTHRDAMAGDAIIRDVSKF